MQICSKPCWTGEDVARIRSIKPEFWTSEQVTSCSIPARLLFIGIWNFCDDGGRLPYSPKRLKMQIFPADDVSSANVQGMIDELSSNALGEPLIYLYEVDGKRYLQVTGWDKHQRIDRPRFLYPDKNGVIPNSKGFDERTFDDDSSKLRHRSRMESSRMESNGMESNGVEDDGDSKPKKRSSSRKGGVGGKAPQLDLGDGRGEKPLPEGDDRAELFQRVRHIVGKDGDRVTRRLLTAKANDVGEALLAVIKAENARDPRQYLLAIAIRGPPASASASEPDRLRPDPGI